jgi:sporulation and cell division protein SsgA
MRHDILVRVPVILELVRAHRPPVPAQVELRYAGPDPYAVALAFQTVHTREVVWRFSRGLLAQGLIEAAGEGDVRLRPLDTPTPGRVVEIELRSPGGRAVFRAPHAELRGYLARTQELIAFGAEHEWLDLDHAVAMLRLAPPRSGSRNRSGCSSSDEGSPSSSRDRGGSSGPPPTRRGW